MMVAPATGLSSSLRSLSLASLGDGPRRPARWRCPSPVGGLGRGLSRCAAAGGGRSTARWSAGGVDFLRLGSAGGGEGIERSHELPGGEVAVQEMADLGAGQPVGGADERGVDLLGERVAGCLVQRPSG
jgi:hypothetical protein